MLVATITGDAQARFGGEVGWYGLRADISGVYRLETFWSLPCALPRNGDSGQKTYQKMARC
jgi:hypothetical protein